MRSEHRTHHSNIIVIDTATTEGMSLEVAIEMRVNVVVVVVVGGVVGSPNCCQPQYDLMIRY